MFYFCMFDKLVNCSSTFCHFDKTLSLSGLIYQVVVILFTITTLILVSRKKKHIWKYYLTMLTGTFLFDLLTSPMSIDIHLGNFSYIYHGVSWILSMGFTTCIFVWVNIVDYLVPEIYPDIKFKEWHKYLLSVILTSVFLILIEQSTTGFLQVRQFSPETIIAYQNMKMFGTNVSFFNLLWTIVSVSLLISFYKYISFWLDKKILVPVKKSHWLRSFFIIFGGVVMLELVVESVVKNVGFPQWLYFFNDLNFVNIILWTIIIWISDLIINKIFMGWNLVWKLVAAASLASAVLVPMEMWFINNGYRVYSESTIKNLSGFKSPFFSIPIEVIVSAVFYSILIVAFKKFWEVIMNNKKI